MNEIMLEPHQYKVAALPCPFCGNTSISVRHKEVRFIGQNYFGTKKIKMKAYCACNRCHATGKPIFYIGYTARGESGYSEEHLPIYARGKEAIKAWDRRV